MTPPLPESPPVPWRFNIRSVWRLGLLSLIGFWGLIEFAFQSRHRRTVRGRAEWLGTTCRRCLNLLNVRVRQEGTVPSEVMLTPNHVGYLDVLVLSAMSPFVFVSKAEVKSWPLFGWFASLAGTLFIQRKNKSDLIRVGEQLKSVWGARVNPVVFLEGTSTDGTGVRPFRPGLLEPLVQMNASAVPVTLKYRVPDDYDVRIDLAWWGTMPLLPHLMRMIGMPWVEVTVKIGAPVAGFEDRKSLAAALESVVQNELAA
jgi:1-acyl-sn-glycerol-3-phosphate acyltransferase